MKLSVVKEFIVFVEVSENRSFVRPEINLQTQ